MGEVELGRYAGPYSSPPFDFYVQSPIGLVPKAKDKTRLIFHLSYDFGPEERSKSINHHTPAELCSVRYNDLDHAVKNCLRLLGEVQSNDRPVLFLERPTVPACFA